MSGRPTASDPPKGGHCECADPAQSLIQTALHPATRKGHSMVETVWQDLRHGARMLAKNPGFSLIAIMSIAIGVGANAAMFSIADGLILRPLAVPAASELITLSATTPAGEVRNSGISYPDYLDIRNRARSFQGLAATRFVTASLATRRDESVHSTVGVAVSANLFDVLRVQPVMGRAFVPDEDRVIGRDAVVVLSHETWTEQFGADPAIVGREIRLTGVPFTVIGITPQGFTGLNILQPVAFYVPIAMLPTLMAGAPPSLLEQRDVRSLRVLGRLTPGTSIAQASQELDLIARALQEEHPATNARYGLLARREMDTRFSEYAPLAGLSIILLGLALAVLLVACANVAGLLTSRAPVRAREIAIRLAIGGSRTRLMRQLITESRSDRDRRRPCRNCSGLRYRQFIPAVSDRQRFRSQADLRAGPARAPRCPGIRSRQRAPLECDAGLAQHAHRRSLEHASKHDHAGWTRRAAVGTTRARRVADRPHTRPADRRALLLPLLPGRIRSRARFPNRPHRPHQLRSAARAIRPASERHLLPARSRNAWQRSLRSSRLR